MASTPHAALLLPRLVDRRLEIVGVASPHAAPEVRSRRADLYELHVHVRVGGVDVSKQAAEAVDGVQARIGLELDPLAGREKPFQRSQSLAAEALPLAQLGSVDLDEPDPDASTELEGVAVTDSTDGRTLARGSGSVASHPTGKSKSARKGTRQARSAFECTSERTMPRRARAQPRW